jgi:hypothetical protein
MTIGLIKLNKVAVVTRTVTIVLILGILKVAETVKVLAYRLLTKVLYIARLGST